MSPRASTPSTRRTSPRAATSRPTSRRAAADRRRAPRHHRRPRPAHPAPEPPQGLRRPAPQGQGERRGRHPRRRSAHREARASRGLSPVACLPLPASSWSRGPRPTGKTAAALALARARRRARRRRLGAGLPPPRHRLGQTTPEELGGIAHHALDLVDLDAHYDASRYLLDADAALREVTARGRAPIVVGGTGLYLRALVYGLAPDIPSDSELRARLNERAASSPAELARMHRELAAFDPEYAAGIAPSDPIRVVRATEVFTLTGVPFSEHHRRHRAMPPRYRARFVALDAPRDELRARIAARAVEMLRRGWIDEVRGLLRDGYAHDLKPLRAVGYAQVVAHLRGELPEAALGEAVTTATAQFAKRQRTWFRGERDVLWTDATSLCAPESVSSLRRFLEEE
ncbi:MAG: tRNA (adenosine(37)-N6)-dimethylallyltransferase MiaA [Polyangiales bacterium]